MYFYIRFVFVFLFKVLGMSDVELPAFVPKKTSMAAVSHSETKGRLAKGPFPPEILQGRPKKEPGGLGLVSNMFVNVHPYLGK